MPYYSLPHSKPVSAVERKAAKRRAQQLIDSVVRRHYEGDYFAPERLRLLRLLTIAMGAQRDQAGPLLASVLEGDRDAEDLIKRDLTELILQT